MPVENPAEVVDAILEAWNARDAKALADLLVPEPDFVDISGSWWRTKKEIVKAHERAFEKTFGDRVVKGIETRVKHMAPDVATVHCVWEMYPSADQGEAAEFRGILLFVLIRDKGVWHVQAAQNTEGRDRWPPYEADDPA